ncbi:nuclear transport factor 2-like [Impatiens glandulifera]|uniref:nuclear transport factor 2-like n=1 Tax=Impatiens glandulifera TaxID=253017 RepID=UPI001FB13716|nr:nuclear transport factor 2-like [Impatiens glandulifera]
MENGYTGSGSGSVSATQVGPYFVGQYYQILQQQPDCGHHFYTDSSTVVRVDGESTERATAMMQIHTLIMSLNYTGIEIKTINSLESWNRGILVVVSGLVKTKHFSGKRSFVQSFYLAPQEKGYFVLNDIFHYVNEEVIHHYPVPTLSESQNDQQLSTSTPVLALEPTAPDYGLEAQAVEYVSSVHIDREVPIEHYSFQEHQQDLQQDFEPEPALEEAYVEDSIAYISDETVEIPPEPLVPVSEPVGEPAKLSYASILRVAKEPSATTVVTRPSLSKSPAPESEWEQTPKLAAPQFNHSEPTVEAPEEVLPQEDEGEFKSVYVRNLPSSIVASDVEQEFSTFGKIKTDGVFIRNRKDIGVCYAFVEFQDLHAVHNAIKASPIVMAGRQVYIEERRASTIGAPRGGGRGGRGGRGRGGYQPEMASRGGRYGGRSSGRGRGNQDGGDDSYRSRTNGNSNGFRSY